MSKFFQAWWQLYQAKVFQRSLLSRARTIVYHILISVRVSVFTFPGLFKTKYGPGDNFIKRKSFNNLYEEEHEQLSITFWSVYESVCLLSQDYSKPNTVGGGTDNTLESLGSWPLSSPLKDKQLTVVFGQRVQQRTGDDGSHRWITVQQRTGDDWSHRWITFVNWERAPVAAADTLIGRQSKCLSLPSMSLPDKSMGWLKSRNERVG